ncbi:MAG: hypothetical protein JWP85_1948 [Rhodoglobus sp.]|nr:hypothetical protein [Rhodoglobus sp.]
MSAFVKGTWNGWSGKTVVELTDGTIWQQAEYHYEYHYAYRPAVSVANGSMTVDGMSRAVRVRQVPSSSRRTVKGAWKGWNGHTTVELTDGSKWLQAEYLYEYHYAYRPEVLLIDDEMQVEGMSRPVRVRKTS